VGGACPDRIWVPRAANFAAVDLILPGQRPANFTINETHPLLLFAKKKTQGLIPVAESLGLPSTGRIPFYWVMPRERFDLVRESGGEPFPVVLQGPSRKNAGGTAPADDAAPANGTAPAGGAAPADGRDSDVGEDDADGAAPAASAPPSAAPRGRGRPKKQLALVADGTASVLDDYVRRIDQYLLLVPFDVLKLGAPAPPAALP